MVTTSLFVRLFVALVLLCSLRTRLGSPCQCSPAISIISPSPSADFQVHNLDSSATGVSVDPEMTLELCAAIAETHNAGSFAVADEQCYYEDYSDEGDDS